MQLHPSKLQWKQRAKLSMKAPWQGNSIKASRTTAARAVLRGPRRRRLVSTENSILAFASFTSRPWQPIIQVDSSTTIHVHACTQPRPSLGKVHLTHKATQYSGHVVQLCLSSERLFRWCHLLKVLGTTCITTLLSIILQRKECLERSFEGVQQRLPRLPRLPPEATALHLQGSRDVGVTWASPCRSSCNVSNEMVV